MTDTKERWTEFSENDLDRLIESYIQSLSVYIGCYFSESISIEILAYADRIREFIMLKKKFKEKS